MATGTPAREARATRSSGPAGCPGDRPGAGGSALSRPGSRMLAGDTLWDPLNPPHPDTRVAAARSDDATSARDR